MTEALRRTREAWLEDAIDVFRPRFTEIEYPLPGRIHVSVGFGYGAKRESAVLLGQCWATTASDDQMNHIFISPQVNDTAMVLGILLHELIHAADDVQHGHKGPFAEIAELLGFEPPLLELHPGVGLEAELVTIAETLGEYPHGALHPTRAVTKVPVGPDGQETPVKLHSGPPKQGTRMLKLICPVDGYTVRTTAKWLEMGLPTCPCGTEMQAA